MCRYVKAADKEIIAAIKAMGRLVDNQTFTHSYPFCWRSETPLIYRVGSSPPPPIMFIHVSAVMQNLAFCMLHNTYSGVHNSCCIANKQLCNSRYVLHVQKEEEARLCTALEGSMGGFGTYSVSTTFSSLFLSGAFVPYSSLIESVTNIESVFSLLYTYNFSFW